MKLQNIDFEESKFNLIPNRYHDTNAIAIMIQEVGEDFCEEMTIDCLPDEDLKEEENIQTELIAVNPEEYDYIDILITNGLMEEEPELVDFYEGVYYYAPSKELLEHLEELKEKYNK